eukprot:8883233-Ditylum_brightwellii.AAC.1
MPEIPVPTVDNDETALDLKEYEIKYKAAPPVLHDPVPSPPLPPAVLCYSSCPYKLNKKYFYKDNVTMTSANMAAAYNQLDPEIKLKMIQFPNSPCCFNIAASEEKLNRHRSGYEEHIDLIQGLDWKKSADLLTQSSTSPEVKHFFSAMKKYEDPFLKHLDYFHPLALAAKLADSDTPTWKQATRGSNAGGFWEAILVEI